MNWWEDLCGCGHQPDQHDGACRECACPALRIGEPRMVPAVVNGRWRLLLPEHRAYRPEWPTWEAARLADMHDRLAGTGAVVWDVGAEEGDMPALYAMWGCRVALIEPNPKVWPCIRSTWAANGLPAPEGWWVGFLGATTNLKPRRDDVTPLSADRHGWPVCAWERMIAGHGFRHLAEQSDTTPTITGDDLVYGVGWTAPDAITIDVEGGEAQVIAGLGRILREVRPVLWVSVHPQFLADAYGTPAAAVHATLRRFGYTGTLVDDATHEEHWRYDP